MLSAYWPKRDNLYFLFSKFILRQAQLMRRNAFLDREFNFAQNFGKRFKVL
jgi:hypothetical protein